MTLLEQKVEAIARGILSDNPTDRNAAVAELAVLMQKPKRSAQDAESVTRNLLIELGVPEHIKGSRYLRRAICAVVEDEALIYAVTCELYPLVAQSFETTGSRAERAIRHAIECAWGRGDYEVLNKYFGNTVSAMNGKPTNSEFIARISNVVRERIEGGGLTRVLQNLSRLRSLPRPMRAL